MNRTILIDVSETVTGNEVIDLDYIKKLATISTSTHDVLLESLLLAARQEVETYADITIIEKTLVAEWSAAYESVVLPKPKIIEIVSVFDGEENELELNNGYKVKGTDKKTIYGDFPNGLIVTYKAGYGLSCPDNLKLAIAKCVYDMFEQRPGVGELSKSNLLPTNWRTVALTYRPTWIF